MSEVIFIIGPTAVGKTEAAIELAGKIRGQIISCDSMQVYKYIDIMSSKPSLSQRKFVPHHLIDIITPEEEYNASNYRDQALKAIEDILNTRDIPLVVGGSGLYFSTLVDGIFKDGEKNPEIRRALYQEASIYGNEYLYRRLLGVDSEAAKRIHPRDLRRIVRALEVFETTKSPISSLQKNRETLAKKHSFKIFGLMRKRSSLYQRIDKRVEDMFSQGLISEVESLLGRNLSQTAYQAIGLKEVRGYLESRYDLDEAKRLVKRNSRHYAKNQISWFKRDKKIDWIQIEDEQSCRDIAEKIGALLRKD